jgi:hypothetical protein
MLLLHGSLSSQHWGKQFAALPMTCLRMYLLPWFEWAELTTVIDEHRMDVTDSHHHVLFSVSIDILETQGYNCEVFSIAKQGHGKIDLGVCCVSPWKLYS